MIIPETLYKYRNWKDKWHKKLLTDNELYFAKADQFNDPFDFTTLHEYDTENLTEQQVRAKTKKTIQEEHGLTGIELDLEVKKRMKGFDIKDKDLNEMRDNALQMREMIRNKYGIVSFSTEPLNILMWSHYSYNHKGFSIGFKTQELFEFIGRKYGIGNHILKIHYQKKVSNN